MPVTDIEWKSINPDPLLSDYVESFWMLVNHSENKKDIIVLPDGRIDLFFSCSSTEPFHTVLLGLESEPTPTQLTPKTIIFAISFKLLAIEYIFKTSIANLLNEVELLPSDFWEMSMEDLQNFEHFCHKASTKIKDQLKSEVDIRKQKLFDLIYSSKGSLSVKELSEQVFWNSRQINRYFNQTFGISLKAYCNILRFRASFQHLKEGKLYPEQNFTDQAHFIRDVKKYSGVVPKELTKNKNDQFIHFSTLIKK